MIHDKITCSLHIEKCVKKIEEYLNQIAQRNLNITNPSIWSIEYKLFDKLSNNVFIVQLYFHFNLLVEDTLMATVEMSIGIGEELNEDIIFGRFLLKFLQQTNNKQIYTI